MNERDLGRASAIADQLGATLRDTMAPALGSYFKGLVDSGLPEEQAGKLLERMQETMIEMVRDQIARS